MRKVLIIGVVVIYFIFLIDLVEFKIDFNMVASLAVLFGVIIYVGYINSSIRELKSRVAELENKITIDNSGDENQN
ncbi:hypothetical protein [Sedimentibacter sp.]|uniref:hypothetical protein n=1 Tax=Sedimentibacter sp. TaxID=1960295 RepID=UPI0028AC0163|nr:hypothetical protein [Sedimentibacter sp.]